MSQENGSQESTQQTQQPGTQPQGQQSQQSNAESQSGETPTTWEQVLGGLPEASRALYESHTQGLRSALDSERNQRRELATQLREATQQLEQGSQAREALETATGQLEEANRRAEFFQEAASPEVGCTNPELAYLAAVQRELFDRRGNPNWDAVKKAFPELFKPKTAPSGNAGAGTAHQPPQTFSMDNAIRKAAGKQ